MTFIPHQPDPPAFSDTLLAFQAFAGPRIGALVEPDPLGPVNKIVTLMAGERRIRSALCHIPAGAKVTVGHDSAPRYTAWTNDWQPLWTSGGDAFGTSRSTAAACWKCPSMKHDHPSRPHHGCRGTAAPAA